MIDKNRKVVLHECPTCGAKEDESCRTPKGRKKNNVHDTRPFSLGFTDYSKAKEDEENCNP